MQNQKVKFILDNPDKLVLSVSDFVGYEIPVTEAIKFVEHYFECPVPVNELNQSITFFWDAKSEPPFSDTLFRFPEDRPIATAFQPPDRFEGIGEVSYKDISNEVLNNPIRVRRIIMQIIYQGYKGLGQVQEPLVYVNKDLPNLIRDQKPKVSPTDPYARQVDTVVYEFSEEDNFILGMNSLFQYRLGGSDGLGNAARVRFTIQYDKIEKPVHQLNAVVRKLIGTE